MTDVNSAIHPQAGSLRATKPSWFVYCRAFFGHTAVMLIRRRRTILAGLFAMVPVLIPLMLTFLIAPGMTIAGNTTFVRLLEMLYLPVISPLMGLFFGCMLVGEDIESNTIQPVLAKPAPRSAMVLGRFGAYMMVASGMLLPPLLLNFAACTTLGGISFSSEGLWLLGQYLVVATMSLMGYGAVCMLIGAAVKWPMVIGIALIFGWQRFALLIPGLIDFVTIEKYVRSMLPILATEREKPTGRIGMIEFEKTELLLPPVTGGVTLAIIAVVLLLATIWVLRFREYTGAKAVGG